MDPVRDEVVLRFPKVIFICNSFNDLLLRVILRIGKPHLENLVTINLNSISYSDGSQIQLVVKI